MAFDKNKGFLKKIRWWVKVGGVGNAWVGDHGEVGEGWDESCWRGMGLVGVGGNGRS